ncbi:hypothetical protein LTR56_016241 [Elasticomyces elasticus]|nr:hypothetical protein LTR56_016241 [Elasticomyces elasticus]
MSTTTTGLAIKSPPSTTRRLASSKSCAYGITIQISSLTGNFLGFTPLNETVEAPTADIVAVTGLAGHAFGSWAHTRRRMWLRDYLPHDIQRRARVLVYGYSSQVQGHDTPTSILADHGNRFVNDLLRIRTHAACRDRPLILIGHSLGGLIIKQALADLAPGLRSLLPVKCVVFLGVPHGGLDQTALADIVRGQPPQELITELKRNSPTLRGLAQRFKSNCSDLVVHTYYESRMTNTVVQLADGKLSRCGPPVLMVDGTSAILHHSCEVSVVSLDGNHSEIAKLKRGQGGTYVDIKAHVEDALQDIENTHELLPPLIHSRSASPWRFDASERKPTQMPPDPSPPRTIESAAARKDKAEHDAETRGKASCRTQRPDPDTKYSDHSDLCRSTFCLGGNSCRLEIKEPKTDVTPSSSKAWGLGPKKAKAGSCAGPNGNPHFGHYCNYGYTCVFDENPEPDVTPSSSKAATDTTVKSSASALDLNNARRCQRICGLDCTDERHLAYYFYSNPYIKELESARSKDSRHPVVDPPISKSLGSTTNYRRFSKTSIHARELMVARAGASLEAALRNDCMGDEEVREATKEPNEGKIMSEQRVSAPTIIIGETADTAKPQTEPSSSTGGQARVRVFLERDKQGAGLLPDSTLAPFGKVRPALPPRTSEALMVTEHETTKPKSPWRIIARAAINAYLDYDPAQSTKLFDIRGVP